MYQSKTETGGRCPMPVLQLLVLLSTPEKFLCQVYCVCACVRVCVCVCVVGYSAHRMKFKTLILEFTPSSVTSFFSSTTFTATPPSRLTQGLHIHTHMPHICRIPLNPWLTLQCSLSCSFSSWKKMIPSTPAFFEPACEYRHMLCTLRCNPCHSAKE